MAIVRFTPKIFENYNIFGVASESNKRNPRDRTLYLPFFFLYKNITYLKSDLSLAQSKSLPSWFQGNFCVHVCFD